MDNDCVRYLEDEQTRRGWTARQMADALGISETNWSHIRRVRRRLSTAVLSRAIREFPGLGRMVVGLAKEKRAS